MKLGYLVPEFPSQTHIFYWREIEALRELGLEISIISTSRPPAENCRHAFAEQARTETTYLFPPELQDIAWLTMRPQNAIKALAYVRRLSDAGAKSRLRLLALALCSARLVRHATAAGLDHIHVQSFADAAHVVAMAHEMGGPGFSLMLHGSMENYGADHAAKLREASFVFTAGPHLIPEVTAATDFPPDRIWSTCMGVNTARFRPAPERVKEPGPIRIVTVARLEEGKGHHFAIEAVERLVASGIDCTYVAAGKGDRIDELRDLARQKGLLDSRVVFPGTLSEDDVLRLLQSSDIFVLPSHGSFEAYPVSVMEAMACGVPVVASAIGAVPEMIASGDNGLLVPPEDLDALTRGLRQLCVDDAARHTMGHRARQRAEAAFDVRQTSQFLRDKVRKSS